MDGLAASLADCCRGRTAVVGLGNPLFGDDGFGVVLAETLKQAGVPHVLVGGLWPERCLMSAREMDSVILLDAVEAGQAPGTVMLFDSAGMRSRFPQVSTHRMALGVLAEALERYSTSRVWLLGVQPAATLPGACLSEEVQTALEHLAAVLIQLLGRGAGGGAGHDS